MFRRILLPAFFLLSFFQCVSGQNPAIPFTVEIEPVICGPMPAMHSFAFAQSGSKWLFVGGRTNGLHGFSTNDNFDETYARDVITVIDTSTWSYYTSSLGQLPTATADPLRATNSEFTVIGDYLYIAGGFGWDSTAHGYRTFPTLTAIHIDNMITAVMNGTALSPNIRQITDTSLRVCGGEMETLNGTTYLFFGQNFYGRYSDPPMPTFTQIYSDQVKQFTINDDGVNLSVSNFSSLTDTTNFHRRDLNVSPVVNPGGSFGFCAYSGVFRKDRELPYPSPITFDPVNGAHTDTTFSQKMNNYTCPVVPLYDSVQESMYTIFFGGCSQYDYDPSNGQLTEDTLVPFVSDISVLLHTAAGGWAQVPLSLQMTGLQGANMAFIPVMPYQSYPNGVINLREMSGRMLAGYLVGGIVSPIGNLASSTWANDTVYRVFITPDQNALSVQNQQAENTVDVFPNPANDHVVIRAHSSAIVSVTMYDAQGNRVAGESHEGIRDVNFSTADLAAGIYTIEVISDQIIQRQKLVIIR